MRMLVKAVVVLALLVVSACSVLAPSVTPAQIEQAKGAQHGAETAYVLTVQGATAWAKLPRCGTPRAAPPPACSTARGVVDLEAKRLVARSAIDRLEAVITDAKSTPDMISVAISTAQNAVAAYQDSKKDISQ